MALNEFSVPECISNAIRDRGYRVDASMDARIAEWWTWYTASSDWYTADYVNLNSRKCEYHRPSLHPARRVCREWASLLFTDGTEVSAEAERSNAWIHGFLDRTQFVPFAQDMTERMFALGTSAIALWFGEDASSIKLRSYDARMVKPLSWDSDEVTECAFATCAYDRGVKLDQLQMHVLDDVTGTYHIQTLLFKDGKRVTSDSVVEDFDTGQDSPTFAIMRPAVGNTFADMSPFGASVFADAIGAIKGVELSWECMLDEVELCKPRLFVPDTMLDVKDSNGKKQVTAFGSDHRLYRKASLNPTNEAVMPDLFAPAMRVDSIRQSFDTSLMELGDLCGFGCQYFQLEKSGGIKTATEVSTDNSQLMRNIRKHELAIGDGISSIMSALVACARIHLGADVEDDPGLVSVTWDDSIIQDTDAARSMALAEMASMPDVPQLKADYLVRFKGYAPDEAARLVQPEAEDVDEGF